VAKNIVTKIKSNSIQIYEARTLIGLGVSCTVSDMTCIVHDTDT